MESAVPSYRDEKVNILLVDDNQANLFALEATLERIGETLVRAHSGEEALRFLLDNECAVILMDVKMPGMDGLETAALIREHDRTRDTPIIFVTAYERNDVDMYRGYCLGAVDYLFKPIVPEVLRSKVSVFVELFRRRKEIERHSEVVREHERRRHELQLTEERHRWEVEWLRHETEKEKRLAEIVSKKAEELAKTVVDLRRAEEQLRRRALQQQVVAELGQLALTGDGSALLDEAVERIARRLMLDYVAIFELNDAALEVRTERAGALGQVCGISRNGGFESWVRATIAERQPLVIQDIRQASCFPPALLELGVGSALSAVIGDPAAPFGVLGMLSKETREFSPYDVHFVQSAANVLGAAIERSALDQALHRKAEDLKEADKRKDEFLAMLAHELRNPLAPIVNSIYMLRRQSSPESSASGMLDVVDRQVKRLGRIVDDLMDVSRITRGFIELRREHIDLRDIITSSIEALRVTFESRQLSLNVSLPDEPLPVEVDPVRIEQVVSNLLHNSAKYTDPGGRVTLAATRNGSAVRICIKDSGIGMAPELLPRVFDLFTQGERTLERREGGLGIGLTLARNLVQMHQGTISATSEGINKGSEFSVELPLMARTAEELLDAAADSVMTERSPRTGRIMIVEDHADAAECLAMLLKLEGHEVEVASDGSAALSRVPLFRPDIIFIDIGLPGMDGYEVARRLRSGTSRLIALSGYGQEEDRRRSKEAGFCHHLVKPVDPPKLQELITVALSGDGVLSSAGLSKGSGEAEMSSLG